MDLRIVLGPVAVATLGSLAVAALSRDRAELRAWLPRWGVALAAVVLGFAPLYTADLAAVASVDTALTVAVRILGLLLIAAGVALAYQAAVVRGRAELLRSPETLSLEEAVHRIREDGRPVTGVFRGRLGAADQVCSPGGVECAFYSAEVRHTAADGVKGALISAERAAPRRIQLMGERSQASITFAEKFLIAPVAIRRCRLAVRTRVGQALVLTDAPPVDALSYERVGKRGEACVVAGTLSARGGPERYVIDGPSGAAATLVLGGDAHGSGRVLGHLAARLYAVALGLTLLAAAALAQGF